MKKIKMTLFCASTVLFANSASAGWSIGGFIGQSNANGCSQTIDEISTTQTVSTTTEVITADFTGSSVVGEFDIIDGSAFDATDFAEFLSGATPGGSGTSISDVLTTGASLDSFIIGDDGFLDSFQNVSQVLECNVDDDNDFGFGLNIAYNFTKNWGIEAGYADLGEFSSTFSAQGAEDVSSTTIEDDAFAFYLAGTGSYYFSKKWSVTGRIGIYHLDIDTQITSNFVTFDFATVTFTEQSITSSSSTDFDNIDLISLGLRYNL